MTAALDDPAVFEHEDPVGRDDGRQPVRDHERRAADERVGERVLDGELRLGVEVRRRLVEDDDRGVLQQHARDGQALLLAARHPVPALADQGVVAVGQAGDQVVDAGGPARLDQLGVGGVGTRVAQVRANGVVEQMRVLHHHADGVAQRLQRVVAHVVTVDATSPALTSWMRGTRSALVVLPAPDGPTSATSSPGAMVKLTSRRIQSLSSSRSVATGRLLQRRRSTTPPPTGGGTTRGRTRPGRPARRDRPRSGGRR